MSACHPKKILTISFSTSPIMATEHYFDHIDDDVVVVVAAVDPSFKTLQYLKSLVDMAADGGVGERSVKILHVIYHIKNKNNTSQRC